MAQHRAPQAVRERAVQARHAVPEECVAVESNLTIDHVVPKSRGGRDTWENLVAACVACNNQKGDRTPEEADMDLNRRPFRPSYVMFLRDFAGDIRDTWKPYLFLS